ncbi:uncharacterized protein [Elaeis guineensis]|uniref:uncharacterized protein isoform X3 n=1 Tax=Elaeis guineensis var. tenera TaxID=51953 RepID=UPI003C6CEA91
MNPSPCPRRRHLAPSPVAVARLSLALSRRHLWSSAPHFPIEIGAGRHPPSPVPPRSPSSLPDPRLSLALSCRRRRSSPPPSPFEPATAVALPPPPPASCLPGFSLSLPHFLSHSPSLTLFPSPRVVAAPPSPSPRRHHRRRRCTTAAS